MDIREYENLIRTDIENVTFEIIKNNKILPISAKSRAGAEISDFLEEKFVQYTNHSEIMLKSEQAPKGKTKNPWDARTFYKLNNHEEEIWIDFKAFKISGKDSNPDIGTPDKIFQFIEKGGFYLLYVHVYYQESNMGGLEFIEYNGYYVKSYFLKDVNHTFRRTPTNQLQVNINAQAEYRSREEFIKLLNKKVLEGYQRQIEKAELRKKKVIEKEINLIEKNNFSQRIIEESLL